MNFITNSKKFVAQNSFDNVGILWTKSGEIRSQLKNLITSWPKLHQNDLYHYENDLHTLFTEKIFG